MDADREKGRPDKAGVCPMAFEAYAHPQIDEAAIVRALEVRYESLAQSAPRIAEHLGVEPSALERSVERFHDRSIGRFERDLSVEQLADVERIAGPLLRELGSDELPPNLV